MNTPLDWLVLGAGVILPGAIITGKMVAKIASMFRPPRLDVLRDPDAWYAIPGEVSVGRAGGSSIAAAPPTPPRHTAEPRFTTLRCDARKITDARWRLAIDFEFRNDLDRNIVIDDLHAMEFERNAFAPPVATISYFGDVWLMQDNSILRDGRDYELAPGDGFRITLKFEATRVEAAPAYGSAERPSDGALLVVFGILVDYYHDDDEGDVVRRAKPSDRIYVFHSQGGYVGDELQSFDLPKLAAISGATEYGEALRGRLETYYRTLAEFRPTPAG